MRWLILLVVVAAAVFFGYPMLNEDASSECDALERASVRIALSEGKRSPAAQEQIFGQLVQGLSKGQFASVAVRNEYPNIPATAACAMLYWRAITDPEKFREAARKLGS